MIQDDKIFEVDESELKVMDPKIMSKKLGDITVREFVIIYRMLSKKKNPLKRKTYGELQHLILDYIRDNPEVATSYGISRHLNKDYNLIKQYTKKLVRAGLIEKVEYKDKYGKVISRLRLSANGTTI